MKETKIAAHPTPVEARVAVLVDCDNVSPDVLEHALRVGAQFVPNRSATDRGRQFRAHARFQ